MVHEARALTETGDLKIIWDPDNKEEVKAAKRQFNDFLKKKYVAYAGKRDGSKGKILKSFDPDVQRMILSPGIVGG